MTGGPICPQAALDAPVAPAGCASGRSCLAAILAAIKRSILWLVPGCGSLLSLALAPGSMTTAAVIVCGLAGKPAAGFLLAAFTGFPLARAVALGVGEGIG